MEEQNYSGYDPSIDVDFDYNNVGTTPDSTQRSSGFLSSFFGTGGTGSSLISIGGNITASALQNRGNQIKGQYAVELQKLLNDQSITKAQLDSELAKLNAARDTQLGEIKTEQTKLYLGYGLGIAVVIGVVIALVVWIKD